MATSDERRAELTAVFREARGCTHCPELARTRNQVVFGSGNADADLMFVGEAPGAREDEQGLPFVGAAGKLLDELLGEIELTRADVFVANVLKCLRHTAMVQLGDGSWEQIGRLVRSRYAGTVMSVDGDGRLVPKRVVGWHTSEVGARSVCRLTYRSARQSGLDGASIELTADHPVLAERGYVPAADLRADDLVATGQGLSALAFDVVCGSVLGRGWLASGSAILTCSHGAPETGYARFKAGLLGELDPQISAIRTAAGGAGEHEVVEIRTRADGGLQVLCGEFDGGVPDWIADELNPRMLAFWFMDDGDTRRRRRQPSSEIVTDGVSDADRRILLAGLLRLGLCASVSGGDRLQFDHDATLRLSTIIAPFVPPGMRHKLHPKVELAVPFDPGALPPGPRKVMYDAVELEVVADDACVDTTFFCIDVEDTHNFVTAGGVVHNCRPPGNRDPLPQEIDNCQDYLMRQVELIEPRVICTLGNFATKLLRADPTGISRLHGQAEIRVVGSRAVRLYPLFHPAAALYTRSLLETLRGDFARLPELLALALPEQPQHEAAAVPEPEVVTATSADEPPGDEQLGLF